MVQSVHHLLTLMKFNFPQPPRRSVEQIINEMFLPSGHHYFEKFYLYCLKEFSIGNPLFIIAINDFKKNPTKEKRDFISDRLVDSNSPYQVNLENKVRKAALESVKLERLTEIRLGNRSNAVFGGVTVPLQRARPMRTTYKLPQVPTTSDSSKIFAGVMLNIADTYIRFDSIKWTELANLSAGDFTDHRELMTEMKIAGFTLPKFMLKL